MVCDQRGWIWEFLCVEGESIAKFKIFKEKIQKNSSCKSQKFPVVCENRGWIWEFISAQGGRTAKFWIFKKSLRSSELLVIYVRKADFQESVSIAVGYGNLYSIRLQISSNFGF